MHLPLPEMFEALRADGVSPEVLARVHAPIGLPIDSRTPEEIAVSIAAALGGFLFGFDTAVINGAVDALAGDVSGFDRADAQVKISR